MVSAELAWRRRALRDLKEAREARERLEETEARFQTMAESISDALLTIDARSRVVYANPAAHRMTGTGEGGLVGGSLQDLIPEELRDGHHRGMARYMATGERRLDWTGVEMPARRADGSRFDAEVSFGEYRVAGERFFTGVLRDVTERRRVQEELRRSTQSLQAILDSAPVAILTLDLEGRVRDWNAGATRILGWAAGEVEGRTLPALPDEAASGFQELLGRAVREGPDSEVLELRRKGGGTPFSASVNAAPLHDGVGTPSGVLLIIEDISRRRELEGQLRQAEKMEAVGRLAGGVAHDFNNLLTVVGGHARMALDALEAGAGEEAGFVDSRGSAAGPAAAESAAAASGSAPSAPLDAREEVEAILEGVERAAALTRQLLALGRAQVLEEQVMDLADLVRRTEGMIRRLVPSHIELEIVTEAGDALIRGDPNQLHRVLLNLVLNAADAVEGTGRIGIRVDRVALDPESAPLVRLTVSDTGVGIPAGIRDRIFDPFFTTKAERGTGLGLSAVFGIITQTGGRIEVETEEGQGTAFHILVPAAADEGGPEGTGETGPPGEERTRSGASQGARGPGDPAGAPGPTCGPPGGGRSSAIGPHTSDPGAGGLPGRGRRVGARGAGRGRESPGSPAPRRERRDSSGNAGPRAGGRDTGTPSGRPGDLHLGVRAGRASRGSCGEGQRIPRQTLLPPGPPAGGSAPAGKAAPLPLTLRPPPDPLSPSYRTRRYVATVDTIPSASRKMTQRDSPSRETTFSRVRSRVPPAGRR